MIVEWKDVVGYEGIYEVSDTGLVRTHKNKTTYTERHGVRKWKQRTLKQKVSKDNTCRVSLWKNGKEKTWLVHRIVAKAFIPRVKEKNYINHIDGSRLNNSVDNLEWCNHKENNNHGFDNHLINTNDKVVLMDKKTEKIHYFRSKSKASQFLGKNKGYLSNRVNRGSYDLDDYWVFVNPSKARNTRLPLGN